MRAKLAALCTFVFVGAGICSAQTLPGPPQATFSTVYCSGFVTDQKVPDATRLVSGEQSSDKVMFARGDYVYHQPRAGQRRSRGRSLLRREAREGPLESGVVQVARPSCMKAMGTHYLDAGQLRVVSRSAQDGDRGSNALLRLHAARRYRAAVSGEAGALLSRTRARLTISHRSAASQSR